MQDFDTYLAKDKVVTGNFKAKTEKKNLEDLIDARSWFPKLDEKTGSATALIRFLPGDGVAPNDIPYITWFMHSWKNPVTERTYYSPCNTTPGSPHRGPKGSEPCAMCFENKKLWEQGPSGKTQVQGINGANARKRRQRYMSNILVIKDPTNPSNDGKVMLFEYGQKIFDMLENASKGDELNAGFDPEDLTTGANFKLVIRKVENNANYDLSKFENQSPLFGGDKEKLRVVWNARHSLTDYFNGTDPKGLKWRTPEESAEYLAWVNGVEKAPKIDEKAAESPSTPEKAKVLAAPVVAEVKSDSYSDLPSDDDWIKAAARGSVG